MLATQCLLQRKPKTLAIDVSGSFGPGVGAKDLILAIIGRIGVDGGTGHVIEYRGPAIESLTMDSRMTVCNMSIEAGARAGMIAPDDTTFQYLEGRSRAPSGSDWDSAVQRWRSLRTDRDASFDESVSVSASELEPMVTFGTNPGMVVGINEPVPGDSGDSSFRKALDYMQVTFGQAADRYGCGRRFCWQLHQFPAQRPSAGRGGLARPQGCRRGTDARRARLAANKKERREDRSRSRFLPRQAPSGVSPAAQCVLA